MGIFSRKSKVPDELPDLVSDEIEKEGSEELQDFLKEKETKEPSQVKVKPKKKTFFSKKKEPVLDEIEDEEEDVEEKEPEEISHEVVKKNFFKDSSSLNQKGFFEDLQENLVNEVQNLDKLEGWYKNKFLPRDIVSDMRGYWEKQKHSTIINILGKNVQEKISAKILKLQEMEKDWQDTYFELIEKEEGIRKEEAELKEILSEFVNICKMKNGPKKKKTRKK